MEFETESILRPNLGTRTSADVPDVPPRTSMFLAMTINDVQRWKGFYGIFYLFNPVSRVKLNFVKKKSILFIGFIKCNDRRGEDTLLG